MSGTISVGVGWSPATEGSRAGRQAAERALAQLSPPQPQLCLVFASSWFEANALLEGVRGVVGSVPLIGQSTAGEITAQGPVSHSCLVVLLASDVVACSVGLGEAIDRQPREGGQQAAYTAMRELRVGPRLGFLLFGDGLLTNYADVVRGLQEVLGTGALIIGGMAGDDLRFEHTYQLFNDRVVSRAAVGALFGGQGRLGVGLEHGFAPISKPRRITRAHANRLVELDGQPAASVYEEYFGAEMVQRMQGEGMTRQSVAYPLGIQCEASAQWLLRNVLAFEEDGSLSCTGEIPEGGWLQLMIGSRELALEAARKAAQQAIRTVHRVAGVLIFDSAVRRMLLGPQHAAREIAQIRDVVGPSVAIAGCYTYGEQAPIATSSGYERTAVQTGSVLVVALGT